MNKQAEFDVVRHGVVGEVGAGYEEVGGVGEGAFGVQAADLVVGGIKTVFGVGYRFSGL